MSVLIVPDCNPDREFVAQDLAEAHGTCYARGYERFDVWSLPSKRDTMAYTVTSPDGERQLVGADVLESALPAPPGWSVEPAVYDDGAEMLEASVRVERPTA